MFSILQTSNTGTVLKFWILLKVTGVLWQWIVTMYFTFEILKKDVLYILIPIDKNYYLYQALNMQPHI